MAVVRDFINATVQDNDLEEVGIGDFTMMARTNESITRKKSVPTTYLEDGTHVNDHQIRDPITISIEGQVSDIHVRPGPAIEAVRRAQAAVGEVTQYIPGRTQAQTSVVAALVNDFSNAADRVDALYESGRRTLNTLGLTDQSVKDNIERFVNHMEGLYDSESLFSVQMPYRTYRNMVMNNLELRWNNQTKSPDFLIEVTQFRFAETIFTEGEPSGALNGLTRKEEDKGAQEGAEVEQSFLRFAVDGVKSLFGGD